MPVCPLLLITLNPGETISGFLSILRKNGIKPIIQAKVVRWIILPTKLSMEPLIALNHHWDLLLIIPNGTELPKEAVSQIAASWSLQSGIPSRMVNGFSHKNLAFLNPAKDSIKPAEKLGSVLSETSQSLELSADLQRWISNLQSPVKSHPISMLNLLSFIPGKKEQYIEYGTEFARLVGSRHGGDAKLVGHVVGGQAKEEGWDEIALAHYPSLEHFAAMISSKDYSDVNRKYRLGILKDTFILCTMEIDDNGNLAGKSGVAARI